MLALRATDEEEASFCGVFAPEANNVNNMLQNASEYMLCRFCAQLKNYEKELLDLSQDRNVYEEYVRILEFFKIDFVNLSDDNLLPTTTCEPCYNSTQAAYKFFIKVKQSQTALLNMYNGSDFPVKTEPQLEDNTEALTSHTSRYSSSVFSKTKKLKDESLENDFKFSCNEQINEVPIMPLIPEPSIPIPDNDVIPTPSFGDLISDQNLDTKLTDIDMRYSDSDHDADDKAIVEAEVKGCVPLYGGIPIFDNDKREGSWFSYQWRCSYCDRKCGSMAHMRKHGLTVHGTCNAFTCQDCDDEFITFEQFVEHIRNHRTHLRNYCKYCDRRFESSEKCTTHEKDHETSSNVCDFCGELFSTTKILAQHRNRTAVPKGKKKKIKKIVKKVRPKDYDRNWTWDNYEWSCQECGQRVPSVASLREHVQNVHGKCFAMKCVDCLRVMTNFRMFAEHVKKHRPYLKNYCQYCNEPFPDLDSAPQHIEEHLNSSEQRPCDGCGQIFSNIDQLSVHMKKYESPRRRGTIRIEDLTCDVCQKVCQSLPSFRLHRKTHDEQRKREYTCDCCGKSFYTAGMLKEHIKTHDVKTEVCEICKKKFHTKPKLKAHVATHSGLRPYTCNECGKCFRTDKRLKVHCLLHTDIKPFKCLACGKEFRYKIGLKVHENQHTGLRPYPCERCDKTFANWANCNKHMIRKHGLTLAKTKLTALGRLDINRETGQPTNISADEHAKEWMDKLINVKRGKGVTSKRRPDEPSTS